MRRRRNILKKTKAEAKRLGLKYYYTGNACPGGHISERSTSNGECRECRKRRGKINYKRNAKRFERLNREWREANPDYHKKYYQSNKSRHGESCRRWGRNNPGKMYQYTAKSRRGRRGAVNADNAKRRAARIQATPEWADLETIKLFYECCPAGCHVDHIVPLQGENVCGLHVESNLQWLPAAENMRKRNKWAA